MEMGDAYFNHNSSEGLPTNSPGTGVPKASSRSTVGQSATSYTASSETNRKRALEPSEPVFEHEAPQLAFTSNDTYSSYDSNPDALDGAEGLVPTHAELAAGDADGQISAAQQEVITKRTLQNRKAQREFRQRRATYLKDLEERVRRYEAGTEETTSELRQTVSQLTQENQYLRAMIARLQSENAAHRSREYQPQSYRGGSLGHSDPPPSPAPYPYYPLQHQPVPPQQQQLPYDMQAHQASRGGAAETISPIQSMHLGLPSPTHGLAGRDQRYWQQQSDSLGPLDRQPDRRDSASSMLSQTAPANYPTGPDAWHATSRSPARASVASQAQRGPHYGSSTPAITPPMDDANAWSHSHSQVQYMAGLPQEPPKLAEGFPGPSEPRYASSLPPHSGGAGDSGTSFSSTSSYPFPPSGMTAPPQARLDYSGGRTASPVAVTSPTAFNFSQHQLQQQHPYREH